MMKFRPVSVDKFGATLEDAVWAEPVESTPEEWEEERRRVAGWAEEARERRRKETLEEEAALARLRLLPLEFRPMAEMPFADLACCVSHLDGHVIATDGKKRTLVCVERCEDRWALIESLRHDYDGIHEEIDFVPTLWSPLPR